MASEEECIGVSHIVEDLRMSEEQIVNVMNTLLHTSASVLAEWLGRILPKTSDDWWEDCILDGLNCTQREVAKQKGFTELRDFDLAALLRVADKSWYMIRNVECLPNRDRECILDLKRVRNNWAHCGASLPGKDIVLSDLKTLRTFFEQRGCNKDLINDVDQMIEKVKLPIKNTVDEFVGEETVYKEGIDIDTENAIVEKSVVYLVGDPSVHGIVMSITHLVDTIKYDVFVNGSIRSFYSGQIELVVEEDLYHWIDINTFRSRLAAYQINNPSGRDLYSLNSARIDFVPYQFRPALKLLHADEPRIIIADSVGVGKTIEAGLIIKELQARRDLETVLIICPKPLVAERKWELEMKRFDEEFVPVNGSELRQIIFDTDCDGEWPNRYNKIIVPYSILDSNTYYGEINRRRKFCGLVDLDPAPHFDLVIIDEAHHVRNGSMEKDKAFEYKCVKYFCDNADAVVMLTATPIQTSDNDLFTLLNLLRPDVVIDKSSFELMSRPNAYISRCVRAMRNADENWIKNAREAINGVLDTQWGENVIAANPIYRRVVRALQQSEISRDDRVRLISEVESLHSFNLMLNRTRRKDIQDFCTRRSFTLAVDFTLEQRDLHDELLRFEYNALRQLHGGSRSIHFMMTTIKRQAASCIFGLAPYIKDIINRRFDQFEDEFYTDGFGTSFDNDYQDVLTSMSRDILEMAQNLSTEDPKYELMIEAIREKQTHDNNKVMIFSTFRHTLKYLFTKLEGEGLRVAQVDGSVKDVQRQILRECFALPKNDPNAIDIMLFTEVGSEGLDYQFCDMMINYDLPWNPMKIEQRIGRIDRRGQKSDVVSIYNVITNGTVDADIYYRCLMRIGVFESSIGECDEILGDIATKIDKIVINNSLTDEERRYKLEQMADNEVRRLQEINRLEDEEKELFGFDLSEFTTAQEIHKAENPWLSQRSIQVMIEQYLNSRLGYGNYLLGEGEVKQLRLSALARTDLLDDFRKLPGGKSALRQGWVNYLKGKVPNHLVTFDSETAERHREAFFITAMHPLSKQAAAYFASGELSYIWLEYSSEELSQGSYHFSVYAWNYLGMNPHLRMVVVCDNDAIAVELPDILQEARSKSVLENIRSSEWDELEKKQIRLWTDEKEMALKEAESFYKYKIESVSNNYRNLKRSLEQKISDTSSDSLKRMYSSQMDSAEAHYEAKIVSLRKKVEQTDIHTLLIANGLLEIK